MRRIVHTRPPLHERRQQRIPEPEGETPRGAAAPVRHRGGALEPLQLQELPRAIEKGALRIGVLVEGGFYGPGYLWHHLPCAAKRQLEKVEEAYEQRGLAQRQAATESVPGIEKLRAIDAEAQEKKAQRKELPYVEEDPSGRAKCKQCGEPHRRGLRCA